MSRFVKHATALFAPKTENADIKIGLQVRRKKSPTRTRNSLHKRRSLPTTMRNSLHKRRSSPKRKKKTNIINPFLPSRAFLSTDCEACNNYSVIDYCIQHSWNQSIPRSSVSHSQETFNLCKPLIYSYIPQIPYSLMPRKPQCIY